MDVGCINQLDKQDIGFYESCSNFTEEEIQIYLNQNNSQIKLALYNLLFDFNRDMEMSKGLGMRASSVTYIETLKKESTEISLYLIGEMLKEQIVPIMNENDIDPLKYQAIISWQIPEYTKLSKAINTEYQLSFIEKQKVKKVGFCRGN